MEQTVEVMLPSKRIVSVTGDISDIFMVLSCLQKDQRTTELIVRYPDNEVGTTCWQPIGGNDGRTL